MGKYKGMVGAVLPDTKRKAMAKKPALQERLRKSVNGYVCVRRFGSLDRVALRYLIDDGLVEIFDSPLGSAYRLVGEKK